MPNFKRFLSGIMALVMTLSMFSCLDSVVANADYISGTVYGPLSGDTAVGKNKSGNVVTNWRGKRNGEKDWIQSLDKDEFEKYNDTYQDYNNGFGVKSYKELSEQEYIDKNFVYLAVAVYEEGSDGKYTLTDHKVKYGQKLLIKYYMKSNVWIKVMGSDLLFTRSFFNVNGEMAKNPYYDTTVGGSLTDTLNNRGYIASYDIKSQCNVNDPYGEAISEGTCTLTANPVVKNNKITTKSTGLSSEFLYKYDYIRLTTLRASTEDYITGTLCNTDENFLEYTINVRTTAEDSNRVKNSTATETVKVTNIGDIGEIGEDFHFDKDYDSNTCQGNYVYVLLNATDDKSIAKLTFNSGVILDTRDMNHTFRLYGNEVNFYDADGTTRIKANEYDNGSTEADALTVKTSDIPSAPPKTGYEFKGWDLATATTDEKGNTVYKGDGVVDTVVSKADKDYYYVAVYEESTTPVTKYNITYKFNDGEKVSNIKSEDLEAGAGIALPSIETTVPTGKQIVWTYTKAEDGSDIGTITTMPEYNVVATASFEYIDYTLTFKQDGAADVVQTYHYNDTITNIPTLEQAAGSTKSWTYAKEDGTALGAITTMPACNVVATVNTTVSTHNISFVCKQDSDQSYTLSDQAYGTEYTLPTFTVDSGLTLISWTSSDGQTIPAADVAATKLTVPDYDVTWTANYQGKEVNVTFNIKLGETTLWTVTKAAHYGDDMSQYVPAEADYKENLAIDGVAKDAAGYTAPTWKTPGTVASEDKAYDATVTANSFNLTIKTSTGVTLYNADVKYDDNIESIKSKAQEDAAAIAGYTVSGVSPEIGKNMPAAATSYEIILTQLAYTVTFYKNEGTFSGVETDSSGNYILKDLHYGNTFGKSVVTPTRTGYEFAGWATTQENADNGSVDYSDLSNVQVTKSLAFYAVWQAKTYTITYMTNTTEGTKYEDYANGNFTYTAYANYGTKTESIAYGEAVAITVTKPSVTGYEYSDWKLYYEDGSEFTGTTMPAANLIAKSTGKQLFYKDTYYDINGNIIEEDTAYYVAGAAIKHPALPEVTGMTDPFWSPVYTTQPAKDLQFEYTSTAGTVNYKVEFYIQNIEDDNYTLDVDATVTKTGTTGSVAKLNNTEKTRDGFTLNTNMTQDNKTVLGTGDTVLKAYFDRNVHTITVTGDADSAKNKAYSYKYGAPIEEWTATTQEGNTATVTYTRNGSTMTFPSDKTMPDFDFDVTVDYGAKSYTVTYNVDGKQYGAVDTVVFGKDVTLRTYTPAIGYDFSGWTSDDVTIAEGATSFTMPAKNVIISGTNKVQTHKITFMSDDKQVGELSGEYGTAVDYTQITTPTKTGWTFVKWDVTYSTFQAEDKVVNAVFSKDKHDAKFLNENGGTYKTVTTYYGDTIVAPNDPTKVGYKFLGWIMNGDETTVYTKDAVATITMGTEDITFTPKYEANSYSAKFYANTGDTEAFAEQANIVFGTGVVDEPANKPAKDGSIFQGWKLYTDSTDTIVSFPYTMTTEGVSFVAVWKQDTQNCSIESIKLASDDPYTGRAQREYTITLKPGVEAYSIIVYRGNDSWYEFNKASFAKNGENSLVKSITKNEETNQQIWTVKMILPEATNTYYAYIVYMNGEAGGENTYYNFDVKYDAKDEDTKKAEYMGATISENTVVRGESLVWTVNTSDDVSWLKFDYSYTLKDGTSKNYQVYYKNTNTSSNFTYTDNGNGTATWSITMPFTYSGTDSSVKQTYSVSYRVGTASTYYEGSKDIVITVGYSSEALIDTPAEYEKFSAIDANTVNATVTEGKYAYVEVKTTADCSKVRVGYLNPTTNAMKYGTYQTTSKYATYTDKDGVRTWKIYMKFVKGVTEYEFAARGSSWSDPVKLNPVFA